MQKTYYFLFACIFVILSAICVHYLVTTNANTLTLQTDVFPTNKEVKNETLVNDFILSGYPISEVPLYKVEDISSCKYFVNDDTSAEYLYGGAVNYYNVVFASNATRAEVFAYYSDLFDSLDAEEATESRIIGQLGNNTISVTQYNQEAADVYMQVIKPGEEFQKDNPYFDSYPPVVAIDPSWIEKESSYGLLNQNGGEVEYSQYFVIDTSKLSPELDENPYTYFYQEYAKKYADMPNFEEQRLEQQLSWNDDQYQISLNFSKDHSRIYLMIRTAL